MTQDSRAFDEEFEEYWAYQHLPAELKPVAQKAWANKEHRILELLGSSEIVGVVAKVMCFNRDPLDTDNYKLWYDEAQAALAAIKQKVTT